MPKFVKLPHLNSHFVLENIPGAKCGKDKFTESLYLLKPRLVKFLASKSQICALRQRSVLVLAFPENVEFVGQFSVCVQFA